MTTEIRKDAKTDPAQSDEKRIVKRDGVLRSMLRGLFWPFGIVVRAYRGFWWVLGYRQPKETILGNPQQVSSPGRQSLTGRKRLHRVTRVLLSVLPRWLQSALGYPVSTSIGRCLSPEVRVSPTKPCGKGSKRKQDELDEDDDLEEEEHPTWVEALNQECADDEGPEQDPDYEPSTVETASEEYCSHNNTEDDIEAEKGVVVIKDVNTELTPAQLEGSNPAV
ncbi:oogenesis-related isoform X1 [Boleophthalmus pectinirostris]|uniref:oogenesis-related isoform X1 n=1 Tax=Boleophthalmus pectinirostris TaxID=150288 RepID=UPI00242B882A|nr:oogenesis-related isoform X1 [Boleophthalmus pectinirostris]